MSTQFADVKPFPKAPVSAGSIIGHNRPPIDVEARETFDAVLDGKEGFRERVTNLIAAADRAVATDEESAGRCGELVKQIRAATKFIEDAHATTKAPYLAAGRAIDAAKNELTPGLDAAKRKVEGKQTTFIREQDAIRQAELRRQREADDARRREEIEREIANAKEQGQNIIDVAAIPPTPTEPERQIIRGDFGAAVSGTKVWTGTVTDYQVAFIAAGLDQNDKVREAIDKAIANLVRGGQRKIEGVEIVETLKVSNR